MYHFRIPIPEAASDLSGGPKSGQWNAVLLLGTEYPGPISPMPSDIAQGYQKYTKADMTNSWNLERKGNPGA